MNLNTDKNRRELALSLLSSTIIGGNAGRYMTISYEDNFKLLGTQHYKYPLSWYDKALEKYPSLDNRRIQSIRHFRLGYLDAEKVEFKTLKLSSKDFFNIVRNDYDASLAIAKKYNGICTIVTCDNMMSNAEITIVIKIG